MQGNISDALVLVGVPVVGFILYCLWQANKQTVEENRELKSENRELYESLHRMMVAGNHLASGLVGKLGGAEAKFPLYTTQVDIALSRIPDPELQDFWLCWRGIMLERDRLQELGLME